MSRHQLWTLSPRIRFKTRFTAYVVTARRLSLPIGSRPLRMPTSFLYYIKVILKKLGTIWSYYNDKGGIINFGVYNHLQARERTFSGEGGAVSSKMVVLANANGRSSG